MCATLLIGAIPSIAADINTADTAIKEAIDLLESRIPQMRNDKETSTLRSAIEKLKSHRAASAVSRFNLGDFIDNPMSYKGKSITLKLVIDDYDIRGGKSLRDYTGSTVSFRTRGVEPELKIAIHIPQGIDVPKSVWNEMLVVTFLCKGGSLRNGNEAVSITRFSP
jgi:hypothetical protein